MTDFTVQPRITGYRQLSEADAALMNEITAKGAEIEALITKVQDRVLTQTAFARTSFDHPEMARIEAAQPARWAAIARTDFQTALMALVRAVAQPSSF
jgi:hypothetical protein